MKERLLRSGISFSFPPIKEMQTACVSLKLLATSHFLSGGVLTPRLLRLETISASVNLLNALRQGALVFSKTRITAKSSSGSGGCLERKKSITSPIVI